MTDGYQALRDGAGLLDISARTRIRATGEDRLRLLHALATNPVEAIQPGHGTETFFLSPQGRIQAHCRIYVFPDDVLVETSAQRRQSLLDYLDSYIIMDDVTLEDVTEQTAAFSVEGARADAIVLAAFGALLRTNPTPTPPSTEPQSTDRRCSAAPVCGWKSHANWQPKPRKSCSAPALSTLRPKMRSPCARKIAGPNSTSTTSTQTSPTRRSNSI
ncbi:MAG: hypothetical protein R2724_12450 [Bryobacterales bacterium]